MNLTIRLAALLFLLNGTWWTPLASAQNVQGGVKAGVNFADLNFREFDGVENPDKRTGIVAGGFIVWPVTPVFAVQTEALYSQKGASVSSQGFAGELQLDYFDIPILARFSTSPSPRARVHVYAGPSFNFNLRARTTATFMGETSVQDFEDEIRTFEAGLVVGAGVEVARLLFEGRYAWGLSNVDAEEGTGTDPTVKTRVLSFTAGIRF